MRIAIMQPTYLPWLGYFELMCNCDLFVFFDDVQFSKRSWHSRNRIKTITGEFMLTIPVHNEGKQRPMIKDVLVYNGIPWQRKHWATIKSNYSKAIFFKNYIQELEKVYSRRYERLLDFNLDMINFLKKNIGINTPAILSSVLEIDGERNERVINICKKLNANVLYDTQGAKTVLDLDRFEQKDIIVVFQEYKHPVYRQLHGHFISHLSALDLLFNEGERSLEIIRSGCSN